jgi:hypothetical protein
LWKQGASIIMCKWLGRRLCRPSFRRISPTGP